MNLPSLDHLAVTPGARILLRVDLNVPFDGASVTDTTRIDRIVPTVRNLAARGAKIILLSHFGRPKGKVDSHYSLTQIHPTVSALLAPLKVHFCSETTGKKAQEAVDSMQQSEVTLLENLRFDAGEEKNDPSFVSALAQLGDFFVNDAFSCSHRAHGSIVGLAEYLPSAAGLLLQEEVGSLEALLSRPKQPVMAIVGGAKISTKISLLESMLERVSVLAIGGAMANTFLAAQGYAIGASLFEESWVATAAEILDKAAKKAVHIILPTDAVVAKSLEAGAPHRTCALDDVKGDERILDIGPASLKQLEQAIMLVKTVIWNGPVGAFEISPFDYGTLTLAKAIAKATVSGQIVSITGGGDSVAAVNRTKLEHDFTYLSTAGGAFLEWLEGNDLPGLTALKTKSPIRASAQSRC
jgi:phosphoglycerate kinase